MPPVYIEERVRSVPPKRAASVRRVERSLLDELASLPPRIRDLLLMPEYKSLLLDRSLLSYTENVDSPSGAFGIVHQGTYLGQPVVVKMLLTKSPTPSSVKEILDEALVMKTNNVDYFATVYGICVLHGVPAIVMKRMDSDLFCFLHDSQNRNIAQSPSWKIGRGIAVAKAVGALHDLKILHRDLKSPNILVSGLQAEPLCITDFGMAQLRKEVASLRKSQTPMGYGEHTTVGSYPWMAPGTFASWMSHMHDFFLFSLFPTTSILVLALLPEIMQAAKYTTKADVYSLGVILWEIFTGEEPWSDAVSIQAIERAVLSGRQLEVVSLPPEISSLLLRMWKLNPKERPTAKTVIAELVVFKEQRENSPLPVPGVHHAQFQTVAAHKPAHVDPSASSPGAVAILVPRSTQKRQPQNVERKSPFRLRHSVLLLVSDLPFPQRNLITRRMTIPTMVMIYIGLQRTLARFRLVQSLFSSFGPRHRSPLWRPRRI